MPGIHRQGLWLWAGALSLLLIATLPLAAGVQAIAALLVSALVAVGWRRILRATGKRTQLQWSSGVSLPAGSYRHPVVLVVGDCLAELFEASSAEQLAPRVTGEGCYVPVPDLSKLPVTVADLLLERPEWGGQLSVMWVVTPSAHTDGAVLANQIQSLCHQVVIVRKRGTSLPLLIVGYFPSAFGASPWFSWEAEVSTVRVREACECLTLTEWQHRGTEPGSQADRLRATVQLNAAVGWLNGACLPEMGRRDSRAEMASAFAVAVAFVPRSEGARDSNLWHRWLQERTGLSFSGVANQANASLPFPDALLHLLPGRAQHSRRSGALVIGVWLFVLTACVALISSARQNTLLIRQVTDDLRRYSTVSLIPDADKVSQRQEALMVLRQDAQRLDHYYRQGEPWSLGIGLYQGERLRPSLLAAINGHRIPTVPQGVPEKPRTVRLDSLSLFNSGSAQLKPESTKFLVNAFAGIKAQPGWLIVITGHTDTTGSDEQNLRLSRARAAAVHDWIQHMGDIPSNCFAVQGLGASEPVASNDTEQGRSANRRVEIRLVPEAGACQSSTTASGLQPLSHSATPNA
ncbi:flagellar motor protein MotB [Pseudomonas sp. AFG_SD02_1510_Pfu_092]|uniref:OmpA family protein n=1 Tax=Pseudomonas sp. AFG_SD02_1510_Pfu_092 TaxID=2259497 RepID=UPI000DEF2B19|nr:OmpA family protein [Pseudomonas sp. AFG_SD02_1510_Pfu_092]RCL28886.1 flagellar motor protein MotB [Pseudomonas sp. AFG_SD02_1510_Pfu_092]